jgi:sulfatase maturation enzyme AslB (radical SAM superfamily)
VFWNVLKSEKNLTKKEQIEALMLRVHKYAVSQYQTTANFIKSLGISKPIHIGETGWASHSNGFYGAKGSRASDEFKQKLYYDYMRKWTKKTGMSCFYFEAFDEQWKDGNNPEGSENHFGLINLNGHVKYALWHLIDAGVFKGLTRDNKPLTKTYNGDLNTLMKDVLVPQ